MKTLKEEDILRIIREEWKRKISLLSEDRTDIDVKVKFKKGAEKIVISPELKVVHAESGIRYTVHSVNPNEIVLRTPEGEMFNITPKVLEDDYEVA